MERIETLARRNHDLEARVEALEIANMKLLDGFKDHCGLRTPTDSCNERTSNATAQGIANLAWSVFDKEKV
jgi:hypothetical protein